MPARWCRRRCSITVPPAPSSSTRRRCRSTRSLRNAAARPGKATTWHACTRAISRSGARWVSSCAGSTKLASITRSRPACRPSTPAGETLEAFAATGATLAVHLSIHVLDKVVAALVPHYGADCPAAVVYRASWPDERVIRATLGTIAAEVAKNPMERTALIFVGKVLGARDFRDSALYDASYQRRFRGRSP